MGVLESFILGTLVYAAYTRVVRPTIRFRRYARQRIKEVENTSDE
jgi:hypothetical protein